MIQKTGYNWAMQAPSGRGYRMDRVALRNESALTAYRRRIIGQPGLGALLKYELTTSILGGWPGGLGVWLRSKFYRLILRQMPQGVFIGKDVIIRNPSRISIGARTYIDSFVHLEGMSDHPHGGIELGEGNYVHSFSTISSAYHGYVRTGRLCSFNEGVQIFGTGGVEIGDHVLVGGLTAIVAYSHSFDDLGLPISDQPITAQGIRIENNVWIGARVTIRDGVTVGSGAVIGSGSVVTRDVPSDMVVVGVPAHPLRKRGQGR